MSNNHLHDKYFNEPKLNHACLGIPGCNHPVGEPCRCSCHQATNSLGNAFGHITEPPKQDHLPEVKKMLDKYGDAHGYKINNNIKVIQLSQDQRTMVDDEDYYNLAKFKWCANWQPEVKGFYAVRNKWVNGVKKMFYMHRVIMNPPKGLMIDHINGDTLDNRKSNLRMCTNSENQLNSYRHRDNKVMGFRVKEYKNKVLYEAQKHGAYLGLFSTPELAHQAYLNSINPLRQRVYKRLEGMKLKDLGDKCNELANKLNHDCIFQRECKKAHGDILNKISTQN